MVGHLCAQTDEELREPEYPSRIQFLQNRWPIEKLLQLEWEAVVSRRDGAGHVRS